MGPALILPNIAGFDPRHCRRDHEVTINAFLAPQVLLLSIPIVGPVIFIPMQAATAWLVDLLVQQPAAQSEARSQSQPTHASVQYSSSQAAATQRAPTMPASPPVYATQQSYVPNHSQQASYTQSAYPDQSSWQRPAAHSSSGYQ